MDHTVLRVITASKLPRKRSPDGATADCSGRHQCSLLRDATFLLRNCSLPILPKATSTDALMA